ncbi:CBS domain-containing protein [Paraburkholderia sp. Tr-20389]|uniref:CBS domain-containing protein n=1 Tax=Paraburkholderia sp. Tr-20389 TaxID=2703903 RepID=UPI001981AFCF|nr:CBS domain-containing protein [Paraburkholderia sp. Tr-20389]MBN3752222.1 CBS domain-containing protein [Paraburkholderia sp. Tr-20389]
MRAIDVMTTSVVFAHPDTTVQEAARALVEKHISGMPVVDDKGELVGMVTEGDLLHRAEIGTGVGKRAWWLDFLASTRELASEYVREHSHKVSDLMTTDVITITEDAPISEIAELLERHRIKRVPVVKDGKVTGLVSRANLIRALASIITEPNESAVADDQAIREGIVIALKNTRWSLPRESILVRDGVVHLWGVVTSDEEGKAIRVAAENVPGVKEVNSHLEYPAVLPGM